jgi:hypothetical protein
LQGRNKKPSRHTFEATFTPFFKDKKSKESQNSRNQGFSYYFCMMIEGSGSGSRAGSGSGSVTSGSGSGSRRPQNTWIRWIRIRNTDKNDVKFPSKSTVNSVLKVKDENSRIRSWIHWSEAGSADPDPYPNVTDPQHWFSGHRIRLAAASAHLLE